MKTKPKPKKWAKTATPNLLRYVPSGSYYARLRVGGKLIWRSLETDSHTVAKLKLRDVESEERSSLEVEQRVLSRDANFGDALAIFETALEANPELKDGAKLYRRKCIAALLKSWPTLKSARLAKVTKSECETWAGAFAKRYSCKRRLKSAAGGARKVRHLLAEGNGFSPSRSSPRSSPRGRTSRRASGEPPARARLRSKVRWTHFRFSRPLASCSR